MNARAFGPAATEVPRPLTRRLRAMRAALDTAVRLGRPGCEELSRLAEERGALQQVATLVARGKPPSVIFEAAVRTLGHLVGADYAAINRYETDRTMSILAFWRAPGTPDLMPPFGGRWTLGDDTASAAVLRSHKAVRRASATIRSDIGGWHRAHRIGHVVACPVVIDDRLWGTMTVLYLGGQPPPDDTEQRMDKFVELLNCAINQAQTRTELIASRARLVTGADDTRRRIERDLHDGAQQHLVSLALRLREAEERVPADQGELRRQLSDVAHGMSAVIAEIQQISYGLQPPALARRGLKAALRALTSRCPVPVELNVPAELDLPQALEATVYYVVSEALTNVLKHAHASNVRIDLHHEAASVRLKIHDDGIGGADPVLGSGLHGLTDRVQACGGTIHIVSPAGEGTLLLVTIPSSAG